MSEYIVDPEKIEIKSMDLIEKLVDFKNISAEEKAVIKRIVHTTGDPEIAPLIRFSPQAVEKGISALSKGASVYTDVKMILAGIKRNELNYCGGHVYCGISDPEVVKRAADTGQTRAMTAVKTWGDRLHGNIVAVGNAPTALFELLRLAKEKGIMPALVVGVPVGFVGAADSKQALMNSVLPYISISGTRGGSTIAAAVVNALLILAAERVSL